MSDAAVMAEAVLLPPVVAARREPAAALPGGRALLGAAAGWACAGLASGLGTWRRARCRRAWWW
jgi:hypothetical protein